MSLIKLIDYLLNKDHFKTQENDYLIDNIDAML